MNLTPFRLSKYELAAVLSKLVDMISESKDGRIFGEKINNSDPKLVAMELLKKRSVPLCISRELIPGNPSTTEIFDLSSMEFDISIVDDHEEFIKSNSIIREQFTIAHIEKLLKEENSRTNGDILNNYDEIESAMD